MNNISIAAGLGNGDDPVALAITRYRLDHELDPLRHEADYSNCAFEVVRETWSYKDIDAETGATAGAGYEHKSFWLSLRDAQGRTFAVYETHGPEIGLYEVPLDKLRARPEFDNVTRDWLPQDGGHSLTS